ALLVTKPQGVDIANTAIGKLHIKRIARRRDVEVDRRAHEKRNDQRDTDAAPEREIQQGARAQYVFPDIDGLFTGTLARLVLEGDIADQAARLADLVHHLVAGVDAQAAGDAFHLLAITDVDPHRAHVETGHTVDAIALRRIVFAL